MIFSSLISVNRRQELTNLYGKIVKEFPFLANQGLLRPNDRKVSIDDLLSMSVFGQPKMGKKWCGSSWKLPRGINISKLYHLNLIKIYLFYPFYLTSTINYNLKQLIINISFVHLWKNYIIIRVKCYWKKVQKYAARIVQKICW